MITESGRIRIEYEPTRLGRYGDTKRDVGYAPVDLLNAYWEWSHTPSHKREPEWDLYCDVRDRVPMGTNAKIRSQKLSKRFH